MNKTIYNLNLSSRYAPQWGAWEVIREIACNAIDTNDTYDVNFTSGDECTVWTRSKPELADLLVMGGGTKREQDGNIGQFGEGFKLAALVATRSGGLLSFKFDNIEGRFEMVTDHIVGETLGVSITNANNPDPLGGFTVTLKMAGIQDAYEGKFIDREQTYIPRGQTAKLYCKGVYICDLPDEHMFSWNLNGLTINRDRAIPSSFSVNWEIVHSDLPVEFFKTLLQDKNAAESKLSEWSYASERNKRLIERTFKELHGADAVIYTEGDTVHDAVACQNAGHKAIFVPDGLRRAMTGIRTVSEVLNSEQKTDYKLVPLSKYGSKMQWLRRADFMLNNPTVSVRIYENVKESQYGFAVIEDREIFLNESLFADGRESDLITTYLHEMAHIISGAIDCTREFENALDRIAGNLAMQLIGDGL